MKLTIKAQYVLLVFVIIGLIIMFGYNALTVATMIRYPMTFSFAPIIYIVLTFLGAIGVTGYWLVLNDKKDLLAHIVDDDEWWTKWDQV